MGKVTVKTIDGNRYEIDHFPEFIHRAVKDWLIFDIQGGKKYIAVDKVVSITEYVDEEEKC